MEEFVVCILSNQKCFPVNGACELAEMTNNKQVPFPRLKQYCIIAYTQNYMNSQSNPDTSLINDIVLTMELV
jgi:hypothetical protein